VDQWISRRRFTSVAALTAASLTGFPAFPAIGQKGRREQERFGCWIVLGSSKPDSSRERNRPAINHHSLEAH